MKRLLPLPAIAVIIIFIGISSISMNRSAYVHQGYHSFYSADTITSTDTVPPVAEKLKAIKPPPFPKPPKAPNLLKMIGDIFKFKKHRDQNEKARVIDIINGLSITDSISASAENTRFLIDKLSDTVNQNFDSLVALIQGIKEYQLGDSLRQMNLEKKYLDLSDFMTISKDKYSTTVTEKQLNVLASKIFPIVSLKTEVTDLQNKMDRVRMLERLRDSTYITRTVIDTSGAEKKFRIRVKNKIPVFGFYNFEAGYDNNKYKFNYINTLVYGNIVINSQNGNIRYLNGLDTASIIERAQKAGCDVALTFSMEGDPGLNDFLHNYTSQETFITSALYFIKFRNASAINISLGAISYSMAENYTLFIQKLADRLQKTNDNIKLLLTIPAVIADNNYQLTELNRFCNGIIVDFSKNYSATAAPLAPITGMTDVIAYFIKQKIETDKIIVCLPYRGTKWAINSGFGDRFIEYISYKTIRSNYPFSAYTVTYADSTATAVMDSSNIHRIPHVPIRRIFYDDENTIAKKYEFILKNKLGGVAMYTLNDNDSYTGLWDEISYAFGMPDTLFLASNSFVPKKASQKLGFFEELSERFSLYNYILQNPCEICYENDADTAQRDRFDQYMTDLKVDSLMKSENEKLMANHEDTFRSKFEYVNEQLTTLLLRITIIVFILLLGLGIFYFIKIKNKGDTWKWKKIVGRLLVGVSLFFILFFFTWMFSSNVIPFFGASVSANSGYSKDYAAFANSTAVTDKILNTDYCRADKTSDCINMPLQTLLGIVIIGLLIGYLITRYLLMPLLKRQDIP